MKITAIVDNVAGRSDLTAEHGLSFWIEAGTHCVLFDTGASGKAMLTNARRLGIDLGRAEAIVISHGHHDHTGGLAALKGKVRNIPVYHGPGAFEPLWREKKDGTCRAIGAKVSVDDLADMGLEPMVLEGSREVFPGVILSGPIDGPPNPRMADFFAGPEDARRPDDFRHELFILLRSKTTFALISGCCHRGCGPTLAAARRLAGEEPLKTVVGGLHLSDAPAEEIDGVVNGLSAAGVSELRLNHCTGAPTVERMIEAWGGTCRYVASGESVLP